MKARRFKKLCMGRFLCDRNTAERFARMAQLAYILCSDAPESAYGGAWSVFCELFEKGELL